MRELKKKRDSHDDLVVKVKDVTLKILICNRQKF